MEADIIRFVRNDLEVSRFLLHFNILRDCVSLLNIGDVRCEDWIVARNVSVDT